MKPKALERIADQAMQLDDVVAKEFGASIQLPKLRSVAKISDAEDFVGTKSYGAFRAIQAGRNIARLHPGMGFGLLTKHGVAPAVISTRSNEFAAHILYLQDETILPNAVGRPGYQPTELQRAVLQSTNAFQYGSVGAESADRTVASAASEGGHSMLALKALTDSGVERSLRAGEHMVHDIAKAPTGIMPNFALASRTAPAMFSLPDRPLQPNEIIITNADTAWLIDHPSYQVLGQTPENQVGRPELFMIGLGLMAAEHHRGVGASQIGSKLLSLLERV